jgi:hypothetical protein
MPRYGVPAAAAAAGATLGLRAVAAVGFFGDRSARADTACGAALGARLWGGIARVCIGCAYGATAGQRAFSSMRTNRSAALSSHTNIA